jgi:hypothetical protein
VHLQIRSIMTSKCISEFTHSQPSSPSRIRSISAPRSPQSITSKLIRLWLSNSALISFHHDLQPNTISAHQLTRSKPLSASPNSLNKNLKVRLIIALQSHLMIGSKWLSPPTWSRPPNLLHLQPLFCSITASLCISKLGHLWVPSVSLSSLHLDLQLCLQTCSIMASKWISMFEWSWLPCGSIWSFNICLQVLLWLHWRTVYSQLRCMYINTQT